MRMSVWFCLLALYAGVCTFSMPFAYGSPFLRDSIELYTAPVGSHLSIQDIRQLPDHHWRPSDLNKSFGFIPGQEAWLKISLTDPGAQSRYVVVYRANLKEVCFFSRGPASCFSSAQPVETFPFLPAAEPVFSLGKLWSGESVVYVRVRSINYVTVPLAIVSQSELRAQFFLKRLLDFSAMGTFFSLILLNLILALWLKKNVYVLHALALLSWSVAWFGILMGYSRFLPYPFHGFALEHMPVFALMAVLFSLLAYQLFAHHELSQKVRRCFFLLTLLLTLTLLSLSLPFPLLHLLLVRLWALGTLALVVSGLFLSLRLKKYWSAFYLLCWLAFYGTTFVLILLQFSVLPFTLLTYSYFSWLQCLSMLALILIPLLSVENLQRIKEVLMMRNLMLALDQQQILEKRVEERTLALQESVALLEEANDKLTVLNRSKARLFVILAHDLRTPFLSMLSLLKVFERGKMNQAGFLEMLPRLKRHLENVSASLDNMLTWVKAELEGYSHQRQSLSIKRLLEEVYGVYEEPARQKQVHLKMRAVGADLRVWADRNHVRLVLRNIVGNALKFTPVEGTIEIWAERESDTEIRITVQDTGMGFSAADLERFQAREALNSQAGTSGEKGLGLGLQACQAYLEVNQGSLSIASLSSGASVQFTLPCASVYDEDILD